MPQAQRRSRSESRKSNGRSPKRSRRGCPRQTSRSPRKRRSSRSPPQREPKREAVIDDNERSSRASQKPHNAPGSTEGNACDVANELQGQKKDKKKKKNKKEAKKAKKKAKKAKKELKKAKKELKKARKLRKDEKIESDSSDSSCTSSSSSSVDIEFVLGSQFGVQGKADAHNPNARISQWLGLSQAACGMASFVQRDDDAQIIKEVREAKISRDANGKRLEDRRHDWICPNGKADGTVCEARNFQGNDRCYKCRSLKPRNAMLARDYEQKAANIDQQHGRGTYNGKICTKWKGQ